MNLAIIVFLNVVYFLIDIILHLCYNDNSLLSLSYTHYTH